LAARRRAETERAERDRAAAETQRIAQAEIAAAEQRAEAERAQREQAQREQAQREQAQREQAQREQAQREQAQREQAERERAAAERTEQERAAAEAWRMAEAERAAYAQRLAEAERAAEAQRADEAERAYLAERAEAERAYQAQRAAAVEHAGQDRSVDLPAEYVPGPARGAADYPRELIGRRREPYRRRYRGTGLLVGTLALIAAGSVAILLSGRHPTTSAPTKITNTANAQQERVVSQAAMWVASQVNHAVKVSCDPSVCQVLQKDGVPRADLVDLTAQTAKPVHSTLIVATQPVRNQFGSNLANLYAPQLLATFGSGSSQVEIRLIAPNGAAAYRSALAADISSRRQIGQDLIASSRIATSATARKDLAAGDVDSRLLIAITTLAGDYPIHIVGFSSDNPGAGPPDVPFRYVDLAETDRAADLTRSAYVHEMKSVLRGTDLPYHPTTVQTVGHGRHALLQIEFPAPSPLGVLGG
jgi:hypothetical protein